LKNSTWLLQRQRYSDVCERSGLHRGYFVAFGLRCLLCSNLIAKKLIMAKVKTSERGCCLCITGDILSRFIAAVARLRFLRKRP
jgi:hypothetical protein